VQPPLLPLPLLLLPLPLLLLLEGGLPSGMHGLWGSVQVTSRLQCRLGWFYRLVAGELRRTPWPSVCLAGREGPLR
jgi:hypothetical protein